MRFTTADRCTPELTTSKRLITEDRETRDLQYAPQLNRLTRQSLDFRLHIESLHVVRPAV